MSGRSRGGASSFAVRCLRPNQLRILISVLVTLQLVQLGPASAEGPVEGLYRGALRPSGLRCPTGQIQVTGGPITLRVEQADSTVTFSTQEGRLGQGELSPDLNFDVPTQLGNFVGHFTLLSQGAARISGDLMGNCAGEQQPYATIVASKVSPEPEPPDPPPEIAEPVGSELARRALYGEEGPCTHGREYRGPIREDCEEAFRYREAWTRAMREDIARLNLDLRSDALGLVQRLEGILGYAAQLGGLLIDGPNGRMSRFPLIHALLPIFGTLFVHGVSLAGTGQIDSLRVTVAQADDLLATALIGEEG